MHYGVSYKMNTIKYCLILLLSLTPLSFAGEDPKIKGLVEGFFKSKESGDNRWLGNNLSKPTVEKIRRMFDALRKSKLNKNNDFPDVSKMSGGDLFVKLVELSRGSKPNARAPWTGAKFRLIGTVEDGENTRYAMYEASWIIKDAKPLKKVSYFKMVRDGEDWKIGLVGDIDRAIDLQIKALK